MSDINLNLILAIFIGFGSTLIQSLTGFWTKPQGAPFVCIEPWNGLPDVKDKYVDFSEKEEICKLKSNEEFNCSYKIEIK